MLMEERAYFDKVIKGVTVAEAIEVPETARANLSKWKWGAYGWVSPASLIVSAALHKHLYPEMDCCKIWAVDENKQPIPGGYSIRSFDEDVVIPMLAKYDLCKNFCSPNSGMQGSRAIEKMRGLKRLDRNFANTQRTVFDLKLFASILNDIDELSAQEALNLLRYIIQLAMKVQQKRLVADAKVRSVTSVAFDPWTFLSQTADPELTKCYVAACLKTIFEPSSIKVEGVSDHRTAADARAGKPGDVTLIKDAKNIAAIEVKDKSQHIDWQNIERAVNVIKNHPEITYFAFVLESTEATLTQTVREILTSPRMENEFERRIVVLGLYPLYLQAVALVSPIAFAKQVGEYISEAPDVKPETKDKWIRETKR